MLDGWIVASVKQSRHYRLKAQENVMRITFEQVNLLFFAKWQIKRAMLFSMALMEDILVSRLSATLFHLADTQQSMLRIRQHYRKSNWPIHRTCPPVYRFNGPHRSAARESLTIRPGLGPERPG
jgi:hypothetical protein